MVATTKRPKPARFANPVTLFCEAFENLEPHERLTLVEASLKYRVIENRGGGFSGDFSFDGVPFIRRPMECLDSGSPYRSVYVMGPSQSVKSTIGDNWLLQTVLSDPADMLMIGADKDTVADYVTTQIDKMIELCPQMKARFRPGASSDNIHRKRFQGVNFFAVWPVKSQVRARPVPRIRVEELDAIPEDIGGEGSALTLLSGRQTGFETFEKTYVNSAPGLGRGRGIEREVSKGTDERWVVKCLACDFLFRLAFFNCIHFTRGGSDAEAFKSAHCRCPSCGSIYEQPDKDELNHTGKWIANIAFLERRGDELVGEVIGDPPETDIASFRIDGAMGLSSWPLLAKMYRSAEIVFETSQDEADLKGVVTGKIGENYVSRDADTMPLAPDFLQARAKASDYSRGQVPPGVVCLTAAVDVHPKRFEVTVTGWGVDWETWIIDRFPILSLDDGTTALAPSKNSKHWVVLIKKILWKKYKLQAAPTLSLPIMNCGIDTGGADDTTDNAFNFWFHCIGLNIPPTGITLIKGGNRPEGKLLPPPTIDVKRQDKGKPQAELFMPNVHRYKNIIDKRLRRATGPGSIHLYKDMTHDHIAELTAEEKIGGLWERPRGVANELLDGLVYNTAIMLRLGGGDPSLAWVPNWARAPVIAAAGNAAKGRQPRRPKIRVKGG